MKKALFLISISIGFFCFSKSIQMLGQIYPYLFRAMDYDHIEKEGAYIEIERGFGSILAIDKRIFPEKVPLIFDSLDLGRKTKKVVIDGQEYIRKDFVESGWVRALFLPPKGLTFWNNGWRMQGKIETIKPALLYTKMDRFKQISTVIYPLEGRRLREAIFQKGQKELDYRSFDEVKNSLKNHRMYHSDLMIWNFVQIEGKGLKVVDLEDLVLFPKYSFLFMKMHRKEEKKLEITKKAYKEI